ncbi:MAG: teichuronic acid biosynthesis protein TuaE, putative secreted polysaccharide polymerase [Sphingobacteriaceae bacterium]|jgi:hypothetical protein|nr:teichuronic acid biosynthesis protein TuaE, putative secreted polysaccharide polymerase [Sphingobacteriaceae bacterium]
MAIELSLRGLDKRKLAAVVFVGLLIVSVLSALAVKTLGTTIGILILGLTVGLPVAFGVVVYPRFGIIVLLISAYLIMWFYNMITIDFPLGTLMDAMEAILIIGFFLQQRTKPNWAIFKNPVTVLILIWIGYNLLEFFNPMAESRLAWVYTIRSVAVVMLMYFVFSYHIRTLEFIKLIIKIWLALSLFGALYAFKQEHFGFFEYEQKRLDANPLLQNLLYINGHWRKSSIFAEPVTFSYNMVMSTILCLCLMWGPTSMGKKIILGTMAAFFMLVMLYSGTRGAYVLLPAALILFAILTLNTKTIGIAAVAGIFFLFLINVPTSNVNLARFQTAFKPSQDASYNVRKTNRQRIQPYIRSHPIGGGLGSTGVWGVKFAPNSYLAKFPPDSGFMRVAVELGWIGLLILCALIFVVLKTGIENFFKIRNPELKSYCLAMLLMLFAVIVGNLPQEALVQFPTNIYFYLMIAMINILLRLDRAEPEQPEEKYILGM